MPTASSPIPTAPGLDLQEARARGVYYTPLAAATGMARWALHGDISSVLEPSVGDGVFAAAIREVASGRDCVRITGVEHSRDALGRVVSLGLIDEEDAIRSDFLAVKPFGVDAVLGNPPYVRLRNLPSAESKRALRVAKAALGENMDSSGSLWMPFVLHATQFLRPGGRLAFVLPYDLTYVRYARPLWRFLGENFESLAVARARERLFPEILQETVILFAEGRGGSTDHVTFETFETADQFDAGSPTHSTELSLAGIASGERLFATALLPRTARELLDDITSALMPISDVADIRIGYVSGDKDFFHPSRDTVTEFSLPSRQLRPTLTASRQLTGKGLLTSGCSPDQLYLPDPEKLSVEDREYLAYGHSRGVADRYKCRIRDPWYLVPGVRVPDVVFPVFTEQPLMLINDARAFASNSLVCGYLLDAHHPEALARSWYTSLTRLQMELNVHSLGGGVFVLVPNEVSAIRVVPPRRNRRQFARMHKALLAGDFDSAVKVGDEGLLAPSLSLDRADLETIRDACSVLASWRKAGQ
jgi:adenine-specific DNA-methyltransferase